MFWEWFAAVADEISADIKSNKTTIRHVREVNRRVSALDERLQWEIGPHGKTLLFLAISPDGDSELLPYTRAVTSRAPPLRDWRFLPAKPRKDWLRRELVIRDKAGFRKVVFDAWRFRVTNEGGALCIDYDPTPNPDFTESETETLMDIYVESELGEEVVMRYTPVLRRRRLTPDESMSPRELRARFEAIEELVAK